MSGSINTVVFDLGNVLIPWEPRWLFRKLLKDEAEIERFLQDVDFNVRNVASFAVVKDILTT